MLRNRILRGRLEYDWACDGLRTVLRNKILRGRLEYDWARDGLRTVLRLNNTTGRVTGFVPCYANKYWVGNTSKCSE